MESSIIAESNSLIKLFSEEQMNAIKNIINEKNVTAMKELESKIEGKLDSKINNKDFIIMFNQKVDVSQIESIKKLTNEFQLELKKLNLICKSENLNQLIEKKLEEGLSKNEIHLKYDDLENKYSKINNEFHQTINAF